MSDDENSNGCDIVSALQSMLFAKTDDDPRLDLDQGDPRTRDPLVGLQDGVNSRSEFLTLSKIGRQRTADSALDRNVPRIDPTSNRPGHGESSTCSPLVNGSRVVSIARENDLRADGRTSRGRSTLVQRNILLGLHRTTMRLEPAMWDALGEICQREGVQMNELCNRIAGQRCASSLTATVRVFVMSYFRVAATEEGHARTGHGLLYGGRNDTVD